MLFFRYMEKIGKMKNSLFFQKHQKTPKNTFFLCDGEIRKIGYFGERAKMTKNGVYGEKGQKWGYLENGEKWGRSQKWPFLGYTQKMAKMGYFGVTP